jgi:hypothetical protein
MSRKSLGKRFKIPLYNREVLVYFCEADAKKEIPLLEEDEMGFSGYVETVQDDDGNRAILLVFRSLEDATIECIAHECTHLAMITLDMAGVPINFENQEAVAYLVGHCVTRVTGIVEKQREMEKK